ncbi:MAG: hypothetical protein QJT81_16570 [Candidatus Thiothrix putei]|uniref:Secreted protein n=1 Tax=Candidatus Thiothrix putei TaxID=3080811 RepID=A0AA95HCA4_9GAMM|nr:MAG: hypothetical protein QJT81_16570 [Candidatus Thiothrix putei]
MIKVILPLTLLLSGIPLAATPAPTPLSSKEMLGEKLFADVNLSNDAKEEGVNKSAVNLMPPQRCFANNASIAGFPA